MLLFTGCNHSKNKKNSKEETLQTICMSHVPEKIFDDMIEDVTCIPLIKTTYTLRECWKLIAYGDYFYLYSLSDFAIQIYDRKGSFVKRIDNRGKGKVETPTDILIQPQKKELWICESRYKLQKYTLTGEFIESIQLPISCIKMELVDNEQVLVYSDLFDKKKEYLFSVLTKDWIEASSFINKGKMVHLTTCSYPPSLFAKQRDENHLFALIKDKGIIYNYNSNKGALEPFVSLDFQGDLLTEDKYPKNGFTDEESDKIITEKTCIYTINSFQIASDHLFFHTKGKTDMFYMINTRSFQTYKFKKLFDGFTPPGMVNTFVGSDNDHLYLFLKKTDLTKYYSKRKCNYESISEVISSEDNCEQVIVCIKIKSAA